MFWDSDNSHASQIAKKTNYMISIEYISIHLYVYIYIHIYTATLHFCHLFTTQTADDVEIRADPGHPTIKKDLGDRVTHVVNGGDQYCPFGKIAVIICLL